MSIGQLGCLTVLPASSSRLLIMEYEKLEEVLDFIATTKAISVINVLLSTKSKTYQLLGGKLSQLKPGQAPLAR